VNAEGRRSAGCAPTASSDRGIPEACVRVLVLSQYYRPEPVPKPSDLAEGMRRRGHEVTAVTSFPNYPSGRVYPGWRQRPVRREVVDGVTVVRVWTFPYHGKSTIGRFINYGTAMMAQIAGALCAGPCDVIYVWHPPLSMGLAAWIVGRIKRAPFVYDVQDIWPESAVLAGMLTNPSLVRLTHRIARFIYKRASHILVVSDGARANLIEKGVPPTKVSVAAHWIDDRLFEQADGELAPLRREYGLEGRVIVMFAGNHGVVQALGSVIDAADLLRETNITFVMVGDGSDKQRLRELAAGKRLQNVVFVDRHPLERMPAILRAADALLVHLKDDPLTDLIMPTKTIAYLASGKPIVMAMRGAAAELVERAGAGVVAPPEDAAALADACRTMATMTAADRLRLGRNGREYLRAHHTLEHVLADYERVLMAQRPGRSRRPEASGANARHAAAEDD
jgi:colanic acid biosynthesis glycosyl transferase WcaI